MKPRTRRTVWKAVILLAVAVGLALFLIRHQPIARIPLPDGTELRLEYVTYGTEHHVPGAGRLRAWASRLAQRWPKLGIPVYQAEYSYRFQEPQLVLWFTQFDPKTGKFLPGLIWGLEVETGDGYSVVGPADNFALERKDNDAPPMPHGAFCAAVYERRKAELKLRLHIENQTAVVSIPNPAANEHYPAWQPESLPQSRRVGELEAVLRSMAAFEYDSRMPRRTTPSNDLPANVFGEIDVLLHGKPAKGIDFFSNLYLSDATGNEGHEVFPPPFSEPAWKVRKPFMFTGDFPFAPTEGLVLGPVPVPETGKHVELPVPLEDVKLGLRYAILLGPGKHIWREGKVVESGPALSEEKFAQAAQAAKEDGARGTLLFNTKVPRVVFFLANNDWQRAKWPEAYQFVVRISWDAGGLGFSGQHSVVGDPLNFSWVAEYAPAEDDQPPLAGIPVRIQIVPAKTEYLEFLVAPPKPTKRPGEMIPGWNESTEYLK